METDVTLMDDAKREIAAAISEGYSPRRVELPRVRGCRACVEGVASVTIFAAKKVVRTMSFRYCFARVCGPCLVVGEAEEAMGHAITEEE